MTKIIKFLPTDIQKYCYSFLSLLEYPSYIPYFPHKKINKIYKSYEMITSGRTYNFSDSNNSFYYSLQNIIFKGIIEKCYHYYEIPIEITPEDAVSIYYLPINKFEHKKMFKNGFTYICRRNKDDFGYMSLFKGSNISYNYFNTWKKNKKILRLLNSRKYDISDL